MKKLLKILGILVGVIVLGIGILFFSMNEKEPAGTTGAAADELARAMEVAINKVAWDSTTYLSWTFQGRGEHDYVWDKDRNFVSISWDENKKVLLHTESVTGLAFVNGQTVEGEEKDKMIQEAWGYFCNDSFWLNPAVKAFDPGVERSVVTLDDGAKALKVSYKSGGVTPGDSYLWILDENNRPKEWKMWVSIIPFGGLSFTWEGWNAISTGALVSSTHASKLFTLQLANIKGGMDLASVGQTGDPFPGLVAQ